MKIKIHKGTNEIGGSCIELKTNNTTILLDYGTPLQESSKQVKITDTVDAILISHPHQDHFGEIVNVENSTPIYCGKLSIELMNAAKIFTGNEILTNNFQIFEAWKSFEIGDFKITPYLVDHSATDAYAFLIEADGKKVLYSGDFRANGRKSKLFDRMIKDKDLQNVDILFMEGTMLQRSNKDFPDEQSVENKIYETIKEHNQISFMIGSSQNIDSIVSAYRACKKANKIFVVDMYTAWILEKMKIVSSSIPNIDWKNVKVIKKFGSGYYKRLKENREFFKGFSSKIFDNIIEIDDIKANPQNYFLKISPWHIQKVLNYIEVDSSNVIYSQWLGYLKEEFSNAKTEELFKNLQKNNNWIYAHTSGHADLQALQKFASSLKPKKLVPIHTEYKDKFEEYFDNVMILEDNESFDIDNDRASRHQVNIMNELFKDELGLDSEEIINNEENIMETKLKYFKLAKKINDTYKETFKDKKAHCRGSINSISLISLDYETPEMSFKTGFNIDDSIEKLLENRPLKPMRSVPEKVLQATIIDNAINCDNHYLPFGNKIKFITSEMAIGDNKIVNDLLCFSEEKGLYIIELKYDRQQKELIRQVNDFEKVIKDNIALFKELLNNIYQCNWDGVKIQKAIVWPCNHNSKNSTSEKFHKNSNGCIEEFCYDRNKLDNEKKLLIHQII